MKQTLTKLLTAILAALLLLPGALPALADAAPTTFSDVAADHWAYNDIEKMAAGNLLQGYGDGRFGPGDAFAVDQMAQIIARAKGYPATSLNGYWAYGAVYYCRDVLGCLPDLGGIRPENYAVPCTREMAFYMLIQGLGLNQLPTQTSSGLSARDIPDLAAIDLRYTDAVIRAYQSGICVGVDADHTFNPKGTMTRAEAATILARAGWLTAGSSPTEVEDGISCDEMYEKIQSLGGWREERDPNTGWFDLWNTAEGTGSIHVYRSTYGSLGISLSEVSVSGTPPYSNSAFGYAGRMRLKDALQVIFPKQEDFETAWSAVRSVFLQESFAGGGTAQAKRWIAGHTVRFALRDGINNFGFDVSISPLNDTDSYFSADTVSTEPTRAYRFLYGETAEDAYGGFQWGLW